LFDSKDFSDVTITCADEIEMQAHRCVLASSSVFKTMLTTDMAEKKSNKILVDDIDGETMQEVLRFIYTKEAQHLDRLAPKLLYSAEKYDLPQLKFVCVSKLIEQLSETNVLEFLVLADCYEEHHLLSKCMSLINT
jgi:hypothetical protein